MKDKNEIVPSGQSDKNDPMRNLERSMLSFVNGNLMGAVRKGMQPMEMLMAYYRCAIMEIETKFNVLNAQFKAEHNRNPIQSIKTRLKTQESILKKLERKDYPMSLSSIEENLNDIAGVRVVCAFIDDIYFMADCLLRQDDVRLLEKKDYIDTPKENGYRSLHLIVETPIYLIDQKRMMKVEVQLRTIAMDFWASLEHNMRYKKDMHTDAKTLEYLESELLDCALTSWQLDERMQKLREKIDD